MPDLAFRLPAVPESVPAARRALDRLEGEVDEDRLDVLRLLVSEMVTNSIRHGPGGEEVDIRLWMGPDAIRLEVEDRGPGFRHPRHQQRPEQRPDNGTGGWGLTLVDLLARRWGVRTGRQTAVWLELDRYARTA